MNQDLPLPFVKRRVSSIWNSTRGIIGALPGLRRGRSADSTSLEPVDHLIDLLHDPSLMASCRQIRGNLWLAAQGRGASRLLLAGTRGIEASNDTVLGVALALAEVAPDQILLVDADVRQPQLHTVLRVPLSPGLNDLAAGRADLAAAVHPVGHGLSFLTGGTAPPDPESFLASAGLKDCIQGLADHYPYLLLTSAACLDHPDAALLAATCGNVVLMVRLGDDTEDEIRRCKARLTLDGVEMWGFVAVQTR